MHPKDRGIKVIRMEVGTKEVLVLVEDGVEAMTGEVVEEEDGVVAMMIGEVVGVVMMVGVGDEVDLEEITEVALKT